MSKRERDLVRKMREIQQEVVWEGAQARINGMSLQQTQEYRDKLREEYGYNELRREYEQLCVKNNRNDLIVVIVALSVALIACILLKFC